jgi:hypothetical protein
MATVEECRAALDRLAARLEAHAGENNSPVDLDRPLACTIRDLGVSFHGRLTGGRLIDIADGDDPGAKIRLTTTSDDLLALVAGKLDLTKAWTSGRIAIKANPFDLLKLRKLL